MPAKIFVIGDNSAVRTIDVPKATKFGTGTTNEAFVLTDAGGVAVAMVPARNVLGVVIE